jgi:hypothetical protein
MVFEQRAELGTLSVTRLEVRQDLVFMSLTALTQDLEVVFQGLVGQLGRLVTYKGGSVDLELAQEIVAGFEGRLTAVVKQSSIFAGGQQGRAYGYVTDDFGNLKEVTYISSSVAPGKADI